MVRLLIFLTLAYVIYLVLRKVFRGISAPRRTDGGQVIDEMVQDPQCKTYVPRRQARRKVIGGREHFFCGRECEEKFLSVREGKGEAE